MPDDSIAVDLLFLTDKAKKNVAELDKEVDKVAKKASGKEGGIDFNPVGLLKMVAGFEGLAVGLRGLSAGMAFFQASNAEANGQWEQMLKSSEEFRQNIGELPIIGRHFIKPLVEIYDSLAGTAEKTEEIKQHMESIKALTDSLRKGEIEIKAKVAMIGLSDWERTQHTAKAGTIDKFASERAPNEAMVEKTRAKLDEEMSKNYADMDVNAVIRYRKTIAEQEALIGKSKEKGQEAYRTEMASLADEEGRKAKAAAKELDRENALAALKHDHSEKNAALLAIELNLQKELNALKDKYNDRAKMLKDAGKSTSGLRSEYDADIARVQAKYAGQTSDELGRQSKSDVSDFAAKQGRKDELQSRVDIETLRSKGQDMAAKELEIEDKYGELLKKSADAEERKLLYRMRNLEVAKALRDAEKGEFVQGRLGDEARGSLPGNALSVREGSVRMGPLGLELYKGGDVGWAPIASRNQDAVLQGLRETSGSIMDRMGGTMTPDQAAAKLLPAGAERISGPDSKNFGDIASNTGRMVDLLEKNLTQPAAYA